MGWLQRRRSSSAATNAHDSSVAVQNATTSLASPDDSSTTVNGALRGLRRRNLVVIGSLVVLGVLFVSAGYIANARFSNATAMAVLVSTLR